MIFIQSVCAIEQGNAPFHTGYFTAKYNAKVAL